MEINERKMKVGIITLPLHTNYGGILQTYALQTVLERLGYDVRMVNRQLGISPKAPMLYKVLAYSKRLVKQCLVYLGVTRKEITQNTASIEEFKNSHIHQLLVKRLGKIQKDDFDAFVVGSDQIWNPKFFKIGWGRDFPNAFLMFAKGWDVKRIAYAPSFGVDEWIYPLEETSLLATLAQTFDAISVREVSGVKLCKDFLKVEAQHVLDPTMLLSQKDYVRLFREADTPKSKGTLLSYILDTNKEKEALVARVAQEKKLTPFSVIATKTNNETEIVHPSVEEWLRGFYDAEFVVTDSFHACVFSILFGKPFIAIGNKERGLARFHSLLNMFGLTENLITDSSDYSSSREYTITEDAQKALTDMRRKSIGFLQDGLTIKN